MSKDTTPWPRFSKDRNSTKNRFILNLFSGSKYELLQIAIRRLYHTFRRYEPSPALQERIGDKELDVLSSEELSAVIGDDLSRLSTRDLKYLLPRMLELSVMGKYPTCPEVVISIFMAAGLRSWQKNEQSAIERFLFTGWRYLLSESVSIERIDHWLCASLHAFDDPYDFAHEFTDEWWMEPLPKAAHYARFLIFNADAFFGDGKPQNPHWLGIEQQLLKVREQIIRGEMHDLDEIRLRHRYEPVADDLRKAAYLLEEELHIPHRERSVPNTLPSSAHFVRRSKAKVQSGVAAIPPDPKCVQALSEATEKMYEVFLPYTRRPEMESVVGSTPLKSLAQSNLADFARDVLITLGGPEDLKHFLPRIFELMLEPGWPVRPEGIFFKLLQADYYMWPSAERIAVSSFVTVVWPILLSDPDYPVSAEEWLCGASSVVEEQGVSTGEGAFMDLPGLWRTLCSEGSGPAMIHWARFIISNHETLVVDRRKLSNPFWSYRPSEVPRAVHWMLSARHVASFLRRTVGSELPEELTQALEFVDSIWKKRGEYIDLMLKTRGVYRSGAEDLAVFHPKQALELARRTEEPWHRPLNRPGRTRNRTYEGFESTAWYRCQELAGVAQNTSDAEIREIALCESFAAGAGAGSPNRIGTVSSWPLRVLADFGPSEWFRQELSRLLDVIRTEPHPYRRIDALFGLLHPAFKCAPDLYRQVITDIGCAGDEAYGWQIAYQLFKASRFINRFDHASAIELASNIRNARTRRHALRVVGSL